LSAQYASKLYGVTPAGTAVDEGDTDDEGGDIEAEIKKELEGISKPPTDPILGNVKLDTPCRKYTSHFL